MWLVRLSALCLALLCAASAFAQLGILTRDLLIQYTPDWKGERFADGRPRVPDGILQRMKSVTLEERGPNCGPPDSINNTRTGIFL
jgi:hypothetical protein